MKQNKGPDFLMKLILILSGVMILLMGLLYLLTRGWAEEDRKADEAAGASTQVTTGQEADTEAGGGSTEGKTEATTGGTAEGKTEATTGGVTEDVPDVTTQASTEAEQEKTEAPTEVRSEAQAPAEPTSESTGKKVGDTEVTYWFRTKAQRDQHYEKHGIDMGFASAEEYLIAANEVVKDPSSLHKTEKEDGDDVYYRERDNAFVIVSTDGYLRTFFYPSGGKSYYDRQ